MILPLSVQGAAVKTYAGMDVLKNGSEDHTILQQQQQSAEEQQAFEPKPKGTDSEAGSLTGHASFPPWHLSVSEGSVSSMDSQQGGESLYSPSDYHHSLFRKQRPGVHMSDSLVVLSDDEAASDLVDRSFRNRRSEDGLASAGMEEGDSAEAITPYSRDYFAKFLQEVGSFLPHRNAPSVLPPPSYHHPTRDLLGLAVVSDNKPAQALFHYSSEHSSDAESVSNSVCNSDTHSGMCSVGRGSAAPDQGSTPSEDFSCSRVKFMCSFGGKILPRPMDGTLRYVGGETRITTVPRDITYADLMFKMTEFYGHALTLKYQLHNEELDALVSVSSDEDLENMMEEYDKIEASDHSSRLRVFLFNAADYEMNSLGEQLGYFRDSEQRYVDAVNGLLEPVPRKQSEGASSSTAPVENLLDVDHPWVPQDPPAATASAATPVAAAAAAAGAGPVAGVPIALIAPQVSQEVASLIQQIPVALPLVSLPISSYQSVAPAIPSAPLSAPSSPPNAFRSGLVVPPVVADLLFQGQPPPLPPSLVNLAGHLYAGKAPSEAVYQDVESNYASTAAASSAGGHDAQFRGADSRWSPESPPRAQPLPRPSSHGKLTDYDRGAHPEHVDVLPSLDFQRLVLQQQQQPRQHPLDVHPETYRRADLLAHEAVVPTLQGATAFAAPPQLQPVHFRPALSGHDAVYWQVDQTQPQPQPQQSEDLYGLPHFHRSISAHQLHAAGTAPSSPRLGFRDGSPWQFGGQQAQYHRHYAHADGAQYTRILHAYGDHPSRPFTASPPRHRDRDHLQQASDDRAIRQQQLSAKAGAAAPVSAAPLLNNEAVPPPEQVTGPVLHQYELAAASQSLYTEVLPRPVVPQYVMLNAYPDGLVPVQEQQEESRRHMFPQGIESAVVVPPQSHYVLPVPNQRPDQYLAPADPAPVLPRYPEADWVAQQRGHEDRLRQAGRVWVGQPNYLDETLGFDVASSQSAPSSFSGFPAFPEDSDALLTQDAYLAPHQKTGRVEESMPARSGLLHVVAGPGFAVGRNTLLDNPQVPQERLVDGDHQLGPSLLGIPAAQPVLSSAANGGGFSGVSQALMDEYVAGIPLAHSAARVTAAEPTLVPSVPLPVPSVTISVPAINDVSRGGRRALFYDENLHSIAGLLGEEGVTKEVPLAGLDDDNGRGGDYMYLRNGVDETLASKYAAAPVGFAPPSSLAVGHPGLHTIVASVSGDRPRSQTAYKPSPLGVQTTVVDDLLSGGKFRVDSDGQVGETVETGGLHDGHHSGPALLAENVAVSVLAPREPLLVDMLSMNQENNPPMGNPGLIPADPSLANLVVVQDSQPVGEETIQIAKGSTEAPTDYTGLLIEVKPKDEAVDESKLIEADEADDILSPIEDTAAKAKREAISRGLQTINNADLEELRELGSGTFGTVYHGKWRGSDVAIKRIKASCFAGRPSEQERLRADFWREACTLSQLHHPNVVAFYGVVPDGPGGTLATVTEYMVNGSMKQVMQKKDRTIDRRKRLLIAMDAAFGMEYLHLKNIVHFDLKCENLLVNMRDPQRPVCKVGDLGLSKVKHQTMVSGGVRGTLPWMAPELLNGQAAMVTDKVDVYSFGIVMWELLTGEEPYASMHYGAIIGGIVNDSLRPDIPHWCEPAWRNLMERCWGVDPAARPSFSDIASELRTMSAAHPKAHGQHGHGHNQGHIQGQAQGVGQGQNQAPGQAARQVSPPRAV